MFLPDKKYAIMSQQWYLPRGYSKAPPDGRYMLWSCCIPWPCDKYDDLWPEKVKNYSCVLNFGTTKKRRRVSPEGKASIRRKRLEARVMRKMPLFASAAIQKKIDEKPDYFDPEKIAQDDIVHREMIKKAEHKIDMQYNEG